MKRKDILDAAASGSPIGRREFLGKVGAATVVGHVSVEPVAAKDYKKETYTLESFDGTKLLARLYLPSDPSETDYVIPNGWSFSRMEARDLARNLVQDSHTVVQYDQRGYGKSKGEQSENMEDRTGIKDYHAVVQFFVEKGTVGQDPTLKMFN